MKDYELYVFILCLIVGIILTLLSVICIFIITRLSLKLINCGALDRQIHKEYRKKQRKKLNGKFIKRFDFIASGILCLGFVLVFGFSLLVGRAENSNLDILPMYRVVHTGSMAEKNSKNTYLSENGLDDQIQIFDLIRTEQLPDEMELELYDIVVYETDDMLIIHRIVEIEEPNSAHPDCRYFRLQGDAVDSPDRFPVHYEQMRAIYRGNRIPYVGSFILFMQSPAGWLCAFLIIISMIVAPLLDMLLSNARKKRFNIMDGIYSDDLGVTKYFI